MNWAQIGGSLAVSLLLVIFGILYNLAVARLEKTGRAEGFTAYLVIVGTLGTLVGLWFMDVLFPEINSAFLALWCFACSGAPMTIGSTWRYVQAREQARKAIRNEISP